MPAEMSLDEGIRAYSATISNQPLGLTRHHPEEWAQPTRCFENVLLKVRRDGGRVQFGWMFLFRRVADIPGPGYVVFSHHAVWHAPNGVLVDVTPFHEDPKHHPLTVKGSVLFLCDDAATPVEIKGRLTARPNRFFPLSDDARLLAHLERISMKEEQKCQDLYEAMQTLE